MAPPIRSAPPNRAVPEFAPVRVHGRHRYRLRRWMSGPRAALALALAATGTMLVVGLPAAGDEDRGRTRGQATSPAAGAAPTTTEGKNAAARMPSTSTPRAAAETVSAPVRIADAASVRLLRPGDRVDVLAAADSGGASKARVVARAARVVRLPGEPSGADMADMADGGGALIVLAVPRPTATALVGASANARLAVTLC
ncbi:RcpC/CpaB family pilus assembly protein [Streptomyces palmae]|uniref:Flp pilus assembly protein RcpC/CpaB domain-containing protein n=1 Tax=Streptomyces palmae TaxID=1701085 RepID=A0A4Z0H1Z1_9ACTN|nr:RcpC/CpaB family pilus assembly protein [Streptomyces palmae]TGB03393.1 hypothetical protein E4099_19475 [Streptomyces palmae]